MSIWLDRKYVNIISSQLRNFKWLDTTRARASCPLCGDSSNNKRKARLYFLGDKDHYHTYCHNCFGNLPFGKFLERINSETYKEYTLECVKEKAGQLEKPPEQKLSFKQPKFLSTGSPLKQIRKISQLPPDHFAKKYVESRMIPTQYHYKLFFAPKFNEWVNTIIPNKLPTNYDEPRLVIPFFNEKEEMFALQGRAFSQSKQRYISIVLDNTKPKIYGLDNVDFNNQFYVVEGPLDSLFLPNCIAMAGSDIPLSSVDSNGVFVYDNEPRNKEILTKIKSMIDSGRKVVIWPNTLNYKDINDMILAGMSQKQILDMINNNTYTHLEAQLKFVSWKRV
jgi:hypothetical protein